MKSILTAACRNKSLLALPPRIYKYYSSLSSSNLSSIMTNLSKHSYSSPGSFSSPRFISTSLPLNEATKQKEALLNKSTATKINSNLNQNLPKLPVPLLNDTLSKYLKSVKPLLSKEEFEKTSQVVREFGEGGIGEKLQALLQKRAAETTNWLSDWWLESAYLAYRDPVVIYSSPGLVFPLQDFERVEDQLNYGSKLIYGALCFKNLIDEGRLTPETMGKNPLDMSQFNKVFGTCRIPGVETDQLIFNPKSKHIVVAYKNYYYKCPVYSESTDEIISINDIYHMLKYILENTSGLNGIPMGLLTTENRDIWGKIYPKFIKDSVNGINLKAIETSLFVVALDRPNRPLKNPKKGVQEGGVEDLDLSERQTVAAMEVIHGNRTNSGNRWFDKTLNFSVGADGEVGLTYEHSPSEGPILTAMLDFVISNFPKFENLLKVEEMDFGQLPRKVPQRLEFNIDEKITGYIAEAKDHLDKLIEDLDMACFTFIKYGKDFIKSCKLSPDSFIQMAIQAAFYKIHKEPGAHYESASTRMYAEGRTETIRSCSVESLEFSNALINPGLSPREKFESMKRAIDAHKNYASEAVQGRGVDRHLLGLKLIAMKNEMEIPELFKDPAFTFSNSFRISTSQVPSKYRAFMCYGPLVKNGYGCCYNPVSNEINFGISAFNSSSETNAAKFKIALQETLLEMQKIAVQSQTSKL